MKSWVFSGLIALALVAAGCGSTDTSSRDEGGKANTATGDVSTSADQGVNEGTGEGVGAAEGATGETAGGAATTVESFKNEISGKLAQYNEQLESLKAVAKSVNNDELNGYVTEIEGKLSSVQQKLSAMTTGEVGNFEEQKAAVASELSGVADLLGTAQKKADELKPDTPKPPGS
jgi:ABC-type Fe3+-citrate transport system substrate-binding protein